MGKPLLITILSIFTSVQIMAYTYTVTNRGSVPIFVSVKPTLGSTQSQLIAPGAQAVYKYSGIQAGLCLNNGSFTVLRNITPPLDPANPPIVFKALSSTSDELKAKLKAMATPTLGVDPISYYTTQIFSNFFGLGVQAAMDFCGSKKISIVPTNKAQSEFVWVNEDSTTLFLSLIKGLQSAGMAP